MKMNKEIMKKILMELGIIFLAFLIGYIAKGRFFSKWGETCMIQKHWGILCPGCGGTRCIEAIANGAFYEAFLYHPLFFLKAFYLLVVNAIFVMNIFRKKPLATWLYPKTKFWIGFIIILLIFAIIRNLI